MKIACRGFIFNKGRILLCKQKTPFRDFWTLPGGSLEEGETILECISREITEEIGVILEIDRLLFIRELIDSPRHCIEFYFSTIEPDTQQIFNKVRPCNEIAEVRFFTAEDLQLVNVKPICLPALIREVHDKSKIFPRYLGNVK